MSFQNTSIRKGAHFAEHQISKRVHTNHCSLSQVGYQREGSTFLWHCAQNSTQVLGYLDSWPGCVISGPSDLELVTCPFWISVHACEWLSWPQSSVTSSQTLTFYGICMMCHEVCVVILPPTNPSFIIIAQPHKSTQRSGLCSSDTLWLCLPQ